MAYLLFPKWRHGVPLPCFMVFNCRHSKRERWGGVSLSFWLFLTHLIINLNNHYHNGIRLLTRQCSLAQTCYVWPLTWSMAWRGLVVWGLGGWRGGGGCMDWDRQLDLGLFSRGRAFCPCPFACLLHPPPGRGRLAALMASVGQAWLPTSHLSSCALSNFLEEEGNPTWPGRQAWRTNRGVGELDSSHGGTWFRINGWNGLETGRNIPFHWQQAEKAGKQDRQQEWSVEEETHSFRPWPDMSLY